MMTPDKEFLGSTRTCGAVLVGLLVIFFLISCPLALASSTASISGTVVDPSGAVVAALFSEGECNTCWEGAAGRHRPARARTIVKTVLPGTHPAWLSS